MLASSSLVTAQKTSVLVMFSSSSSSSSAASPRRTMVFSSSSEIWRELLRAEAVSVRVVPPLEVGSMSEPREVWVPNGKTHVAREVLNKI
jgi:hypothetical protein